MRIPRLLITALLLTLVATSAAAKRPIEPSPSPLYVLDKAPLPQGSRPLLPDAAEEFLIEVDPDEVAANPASFLIDLPDQPLLEAVRTSFVSYGTDWKSWFGTLRYASGGEAIGSVHIGYHGAQITALFELADERYRIVGGFGERHRLARLAAEKTPRSCSLEPLADSLELPFDKGTPRMISAPLISPCYGGPSVEIDVLVVYPSKAPLNSTLKAYFEMDPNGPDANREENLHKFVKDSISFANQVFANNKIGVKYVLKGPVPLINQDNPNDPLVPSTGLRDVHKWMNSEYTELRNLRDAFAADVVAVYTPFAWEGQAYTYDRNCGLANLPRNANQFFASYGPNNGLHEEPLNKRAFSVHRDACGLADLTLGHEIGHNYGMRHHNDGDEFPLFTWGLGYNFSFIGSDGKTKLKATIMGCNCASGCTAQEAPACNRIMAFSDPNKRYDPATMTIGDTGSILIGDSAHNNARVACDQVASYSEFRTPSSQNTPPKPSFTVSCLGRTCTFNAAGTTDNSAIPWNNYWWDFGDGKGIRRDDNNVTYTYDTSFPTGKSFRVHLVVKDSGAPSSTLGQTGVAWGTVTIPPVYEGYHDIGTCRDIYGWAWDKNMPNTPINVEIYRDNTYVSTVSAGLYRADLVAAGKGNGYHGFNYVPSSSAWRDGRWHSALVRFPGTPPTSLTWSPRNIVCNACSLCDLPIGETLPTGQYTVGTQLSSSTGGRIVQLGFYRASGETGPNTLSLWADGGGSPLATVTPTCSSAGWCWASIPPVTITAGTRYRVGVTVNTSYVKTGCGIPGGYNNGYGPLTAHQGVWSAGSNIFPTTGTCSNFFVDVRFDV